jgi:pimeloyl-ACP methyl ester carboxylesterase
LGKKSLVILGETDEVFGGEATKKELKDCGWKGDVVEMKDVGHLIAREKPEETAELLGKYWSVYEDD